MIDNTYKVDDCVVLHEDETSLIYYGRIKEIYNNSICVNFYNDERNGGMADVNWWFSSSEIDVEIKKDTIVQLFLI